jgi:long-chain acyl-CoA synthetase
MQRSSLTAFFKEFARHARGPAFVERRGYRRAEWSYERFVSLAEGCAALLARQGVSLGDRVLLWGENSAEWAAAFWGIILRGAVAVPMDAAATPEFAARVAHQAGAKLALASRPLAAALGGVPTLVLDDVVQMVSGFEPAESRAAFAEALDRRSIAQIIFTSGTTAEPRGVVLTHGNILANLEPLERGIQPYLKYERFFHPLRFLCLVPLTHVFGQFMGLFVPPLFGATVVFEPSANPTDVMAAVRRERATMLAAVPRMMDALRHKLERDLEAEGRLPWFARTFARAEGKPFLRRAWMFRRIHRRFGWKFWALVSGGAALSAETEEFWSRLGYAMVQGYGLTETTSLISLNHPFRVGRGSVGKVLPGRELRLAEDGEILVRGESVAAGYWEGGGMRPLGAALREGTPENAGWFRTGDVGALDAEGRLAFRGRKKNVVVTPAGMNVYPEDLETALRHDPAVRDCVVLPLETGGNAEPCAVLLLEEDGGDAVGVIERVNRSLAEYQRIRRWLVWPESDFPRTSTGKPRTGLVAERVRAELAAPRSANGTHAAARSASRSVLGELLVKIGHRPGAATSPSAANEEDLQLSSLDRVELLSAIEDRFQVDLNEAAFAEARTADEIEKLLAHETTRRSEYVYPRWTQREPVRWLRLAAYYALVWPATHLLAHPRVTGREHLWRLRGPVIVIANHVTRRTDVGFILAALPPHLRHRLATAMGGETLQRMRRPPREWFFFKRWVYALGYGLVVALFNVFPLPQQSGFRESFRFAGESADRGYSVLVFPEGEVTPDGQIAPFRTGIGLLAENLHLPVVPMRIDGLWEVKQTGWRFARPGRIQVRIGAPITFPPGMPPEEIARALESLVRAL